MRKEKLQVILNQFMPSKIKFTFSMQMATGPSMRVLKNKIKRNKLLKLIKNIISNCISPFG